MPLAIPHTAGPWTAEGSETTLASWVKGPDGKRICTMRPCGEDWSNANLIAAAPDLLAALDAIVNHKEHFNPLSGRNVVAARAAIAKAKGGR